MDKLPILVFLVTAFANVDVALLANTNLTDNLLDMTSFHEHLQGQIVVAHVGEGVATVIFASVKHTLMFKKVIHYFEGIGALEVS